MIMPKDRELKSFDFNSFNFLRGVIVVDEDSRRLLLELALHRYDEEVQRNELIDSKNKSIVAFLGVMLTIQCTIFPRLIEFKVMLSSLEMSILVIVFLISLIFYLISWYSCLH